MRRYENQQHWTNIFFVQITFCSISYEITKFDKLHCTLHIVIIATFECACWGEYIDLKDQLEC